MKALLFWSRVRDVSAPLALLVALHAPICAQSEPAMVQGVEPQAPPLPPSIQISADAGKENGSPKSQFGFGNTLYSIGQPTDEEQLYLEYINRSRANPTAEGVRLAITTDADVLSAYNYFGVNLALMQTEFATNPPVAPLAFNAKLIDAARWHSGDMFTNMYQAHFQTNGGIVRDPGQRISFKGYPWNTYGENIYAYASSVFYGHAGLNVDWGPGVGGMQTPPGHRNNIHAAAFREIGIGVVDGMNGSVGPQIVTQDLASQAGNIPLITGVAYYDFNGNGFYDVGEGLGGITVGVNNSAYYAITAASGGFTVPVTTNGTYQVVFSGAGFGSNIFSAVISTFKNAKIDFVPIYTPPVISGPISALLNQSNLYTFNAVGGATAYEWLQTQLLPYLSVEGAESGLTAVTVDSSPGYPVQDSSVKASGLYSFHLAHPSGADQSLTLNPVLLIKTNSQLAFSKRLGWASSAQVGRAQVSTNGGASWTDVWSQAGTSSSGDLSFSRVTNSLAAYAGQSAQIRFIYDYTTGGYYNQTDPGVGLYVDDISVLNAEQLASPVTNTVTSGTSFYFMPTNSIDSFVAVRAVLPGRTLNWGPSLRILVSAAAPVLQLAAKPVVSGSQVQLDFNVSNFRSGTTFQLWKSASPSGTWTLDSGASFSTLVPNSAFRATTSTLGAGSMFYKVKATY